LFERLMEESVERCPSVGSELAIPIISTRAGRLRALLRSSRRVLPLAFQISRSREGKKGHDDASTGT